MNSLYCHPERSEGSCVKKDPSVAALLQDDSHMEID
jgi:hypothetical protein